MNKNKYLYETFPLYHSGYMSGKDVFSMLICAGQLRALEEYLEKENICILNESVLKAFYKKLMLDKAVSVSDEAVGKAGEAVADKKEGYGVFSLILDYTDWNLLAGSFAYDLYSTINSAKEIYRCTAGETATGRVILLDFLEAETVTELARIVRYSVFKIGQMDITAASPHIARPGIQAVRPPYDEWGMIIHRC